MYKYFKIIIIIFTVIILSAKTYGQADTSGVKFGLGLSLLGSSILSEQYFIPLSPLIELHLVATNQLQFSAGIWYNFSSTGSEQANSQKKSSSTTVLNLSMKYLLLASKVSPYLGFSYEYGSFPSESSSYYNFTETPTGYSLGMLIGGNFRLSKYFSMYTHIKFGYSNTYGNGVDYGIFDSRNGRFETRESFSLIGASFGLYYKF